jgi:hypothetical protein
MGLSQHTPSTPFPRDGGNAQPHEGAYDGLDDMTGKELASLCESLDLPHTGKKAELIERVREHRAGSSHSSSHESDSEGGGQHGDGADPDIDADQTGADANPAPDHDGVVDPSDADVHVYDDPEGDG